MPKYPKNKGVDGPAGLKCPCCRCGSKKDAQRRFWRALRRKQKQELALESHEPDVHPAEIRLADVERKEKE